MNLTTAQRLALDERVGEEIDDRGESVWGVPMKLQHHPDWFGYYGAFTQNWVMKDERDKWLFTVQCYRFNTNDETSWSVLVNGPAECFNDLVHDISKEDALFLLGLSRHEAREQVEKVYGAIHVG